MRVDHVLSQPGAAHESKGVGQFRCVADEYGHDQDAERRASSQRVERHVGNEQHAEEQRIGVYALPQPFERQQRQQAHRQPAAQPDAERPQQGRYGGRQFRGAGNGYMNGRHRNDHAQHVGQGRFQAHEVRQGGREFQLADGRHDHDRTRSPQNGAQRDAVKPRPALWKPAYCGGQHGNQGYGAAGYDEADQAQEGGPGRGARCVAHPKFAPAVEQHDDQRNGPEVGGDVAERLPIHDMEHRAKQNAHAKEPDHIRHPGSFKDQLANDADQEDGGDQEQEKGNGIHPG